MQSFAVRRLTRSSLHTCTALRFRHTSPSEYTGIRATASPLGELPLVAITIRPQLGFLLKIRSHHNRQAQRMWVRWLEP